MKHLLLIFLSLIISLASKSETPSPSIKSIRMTSHVAVRKGDSWIPGSINARIYFVKFDDQGRKMVESSIEPEGDIHSKIYYQYDETGRITEEAILQSGTIRYYRYQYGADGKVIGITELDNKRNERFINTLLFDEEGRIAGRVQKDVKNGTQIDIELNYNNKGQVKKVVVDNNMGSKLSRKLEKNDTIPLKIQSETFGLFPSSPPDVKREYEKDDYGNWIVSREFNGDNVEFIILREIDYGIPKTDWEKMGMEAKVRTARQNSYRAIYKGPKSVDKGKREGEFFYYEFNPQGYKIKQDIYSATGLIQERWEYSYNDKHQIIKETRKTPAGKVMDYMQCDYLDNGKLKNKTLFDAAGKVTGKIVYRYDGENNCIREIKHLPDGTVSSEYAYTYDAYGRQAGRKVIKHGDGENAYSFVRSWNHQGRLTSEQVNLLSGTGGNSFTYTYNNNGRLISGTEELQDKSKIDYIYKFHNDPKDNWKIRIKYVNDKPTVYQERTYTYFK